MDIDPRDGKQIIKDLELVWHHVDNIDIDFESTIHLVTREAHNRTFNHTGSHKQLKKLFEIVNILP